MRVACIQLSTGEILKILLIKKLIYKSIKLKADLILTPEATTLLKIKKKIIENVHYMRGDHLLSKKDCQKI